MTSSKPRVRHWPLPLQGVSDLSLTVDSAHVRIVSLEQGGAGSLEVTGRDADLIQPRITAHDRANRADVDLRAASPPAGHWPLEVVAHVPTGIALVLDLQGGAVEIAEMDLRALTVHMVAGQVRLVDVGTALDVATSAGQVIGRGLRGRLDVSTVAGQIDLDVAGLDAGEHVVQSEAGAIRLALRAGLDVRVDARVGVGVVLGTFPSAPRAAAVLRVQSGVGTVQLETAQSR